MAWRVGVDIGGTFADFAALDTATGRMQTLKVLTTPAEPGRDVAAGLRHLIDDGLDPRRVERFVHGTTVGVNTIIQRRGAPLALFTTAGFTDMLKHYEAHAPLKRNVVPDELGATGVFLASDGAAAITGQVIYVDCGYQIMGM